MLTPPRVKLPSHLAAGALKAEAKAREEREPKVGGQYKTSWDHTPRNPPHNQRKRKSESEKITRLKRTVLSIAPLLPTEGLLTPETIQKSQFLIVTQIVDRDNNILQK